MGVSVGRRCLDLGWLFIGVCKDNLVLYLAAFKVCRRSRSMRPIDAVKEVLRAVLVAPLAVIKDCSSNNPEISHNILI